MFPFRYGRRNSGGVTPAPPRGGVFPGAPRVCGGGGCGQVIVLLSHVLTQVLLNTVLLSLCCVCFGVDAGTPTAKEGWVVVVVFVEGLGDKPSAY